MPSGRLQVIVNSLDGPDTSGCYCVLLGPGGQRFVTGKGNEVSVSAQKFTVDIPAGTHQLDVEMYHEDQPARALGSATCSLRSVFDEDKVQEQVSLVQGDTTVGEIKVCLRFFRERSFDRDPSLPNNTQAWRMHRRGQLGHAPLHQSSGLTSRA